VFGVSTTKLNQQSTFKILEEWAVGLGVNGFEGDRIPGWLLQAFDARTTLPHGPLDRFPIPLEGEIIGGRVLMPKSGSPARHVVQAACKEPVAESLRFLTEYLPLAGYVLFGEGSLPAPRNFIGRTKNPSYELLLIRRPPFVGTVLLRARENNEGSLIEADVAHPHHPDANNVVDFTNPRANNAIHWRSLDD
jgi:hypothetical protein